MGAEAAGRAKGFCATLRAIILGGTLAWCSVSAVFGGSASGFGGSTQLAELYHRLRLKTGSDTIGTVYVTEERMMRYHADYDMDAALQLAQQVNRYAAAQTAPVYWMAVPTAAGIYAETLPKGAPQAGEQALINEVSAALDDNITQIDVYSWLYSMRDAYIYYRTDPRWTTYGAYCAYKTAIRKMGFSGLGYDRFVIKHITSAYEGSFVQETGYEGIAPDVVDIYQCDGGVICTKITAVDAQGNLSQIDALYDTALCADGERLRTEAYSVFAAAQMPVLQIETDLRNARHLLIVTDSYGACMVSFFTEHYSSVTVVNTEAAPDLAWQQYVTQQPTQILMICSADTIAAGGVSS